MSSTIGVCEHDSIVLVGVLGDERGDLGLFDDSIVESVEVGVGVGNCGGDADEKAVFEVLDAVC